MHNKQNNKESKSYVQGLRPFGNTLPRGIKGILKKNGYNYSEIINKWNFLVGEDISNCCYPKSIKVSQANKNGTLVLSVERGNEINVEYSKNEIINKINSYFGYKLISKIRLQTFNSANIKQKKQNTLSKNNDLGFLKKFNLPKIKETSKKNKKWKFLCNYKNYISNKKLNINLYYKFSSKIPSEYNWYSLNKNNEFIPTFTKKIFKQVSHLY